MAWTKVAEKGEIQTGKSKEFEVDGNKKTGCIGEYHSNIC